MLNPMATLYVHKGDNRDFNDKSEEKNDIEVNLDVESKKASSNAMLTSKCKIDKWTIPKTRKMTKIKNAAIDKERKQRKIETSNQIKKKFMQI